MCPLDLAKWMIMFNEEMNDIMKIIKSFHENGLLIVSETIENEKNNKKVDLSAFCLIH